MNRQANLYRVIPALLGLIAPVAAVKVLSGFVRAAGAALRSAAAPAALPVPPVVEKAAEVSEQVSDSPVIFAYDGLSRRTKITEYTNGTVTSKKLYWWLGGSIACERDGLVSGFPITKRYFGQGVLQGTTKLFYTTDHLGSVRELVDDAGTVQAQYRYSTYGERTKESGNLDSDWGYAGLWHHAPSGLDLATYRLYDAKNRRWISRDPLGEGVDFNLYTYCRNSPVNIRDTKGLQPGDVIPEVPAERPGGFGDIDVLPNSMPIPASGGPAVEPITPSSPDDNYLVGDWFIRVKFKAFCVCPPGTEVVESGWDFVDTQDVAELHGSGSYAKIRRSPGRIGIGFKCKCKKKGSQCEPFNGTVQDGSIEWSDPSRQRKDINLTVT